MIPKNEIVELATQASLQTHVIEKDYVLGWLLAGINQHPALHDTWVFKGGTCLKKCYFETYRFSEDLDFTSQSPPSAGSSQESCTPRPYIKRSSRLQQSAGNRLRCKTNSMILTAFAHR